MAALLPLSSRSSNHTTGLGLRLRAGPAMHLLGGAGRGRGPSLGRAQGCPGQTFPQPQPLCSWLCASRLSPPSLSRVYFCPAVVCRACGVLRCAPENGSKRRRRQAWSLNKFSLRKTVPEAEGWVGAVLLYVTRFTHLVTCCCCCRSRPPGVIPLVCYSPISSAIKAKAAMLGMLQ